MIRIIISREGFEPGDMIDGIPYYQSGRIIGLVKFQEYVRNSENRVNGPYEWQDIEIIENYDN